MSKKIFVAIIGGLVLAAGLIAPAQAITSETDDGNGHPMVGALIVQHPSGTGSRATCTGTLVAADVLLTAAHCPFAEDGQVIVNFDNPLELSLEPIEFSKAPDGATGSYHRHPKYVTSTKYDMAVVVLDKKQNAAPATLPQRDFLSGQSLNGLRFISVGYGVDLPESGPGGHQFVQSGRRKVATSTFKSLTSSSLTTAQKLSKGDSGTCAGDSGGPTFWIDPTTGKPTTMLVSITITGDANCKSTNVTNRMDTQIARDFLSTYGVPLP